jgi:cytochrome c-type biogenesis protein CcmH
MGLVVTAIFGALAVLAAAFVCWPVLRRHDQRSRSKLLLAAATTALVLGIGGGSYLILGSPSLAERAFSSPSPHDLRGLIAVLARTVRNRPNDARGWVLLGRGYLTLGDASDAGAAFRRAIPVAPAAQRPELYSAYGEALTLASGGAVAPDAEQAFALALQGDPKDFAARYYLGLAYASRGDNARAIALWNSLLADAPLNAPWRAELVDRMALLRAANGTAPDIGAMVASLAERLKKQPADLEGWQRLIRAYSVLGDNKKATNALAQARTTLKADPQAQARLSLEARQLKLER